MFNFCQVDPKSCKQFSYQCLLFSNQFALWLRFSWSQTLISVWKLGMQHSAAFVTLNPIFPSNLSLYFANGNLFRGWKKTGDTVRTTRSAPALPTLDRVTWPVVDRWERVDGEVVEVHPSLIACKVEKMQPWPPEIRVVGTTAWSGSVTWQFWTEKMVLWVVDKRWEGALKGWKSVCQIRLKQQEFLDVAVPLAPRMARFVLRQEAVSPWWRLQLQTCDEPLGLRTWPL